MQGFDRDGRGKKETLQKNRKIKQRWITQERGANS